MLIFPTSEQLRPKLLQTLECRVYSTQQCGVHFGLECFAFLAAGTDECLLLLICANVWHAQWFGFRCANRCIVLAHLLWGSGFCLFGGCCFQCWDYVHEATQYYTLLTAE